MTTQPTDKQYRGARLSGLSGYPIGATWGAETEDHERAGKIELTEIRKNIEVWVWTTFYKDGSFHKSDWAPTYRRCRDEIPLWNTHGKPVFRRIK